MVLLSCLKKRSYWWDTHPNNKCIKSHNGRLVTEVPRIYRQYILEYTLLENMPGSVNALF